MIRSLHQPTDSASVKVCTIAGVGQCASVLCEQCGPMLLCVWGEVTSASQRRSMTPLIKKAYHLYFGCKLGDQEKKWTPHIVCKSCAIRFGGWINHNGMSMKFAVPVVWWEISKQSSSCWFCLTRPVASSMSRKKKQRIDYPNIPSASGVPMDGGFGEIQTLPPPQKFGSFDKVETDCKLSGKCLVFLFHHPDWFKNC